MIGAVRKRSSREMKLLGVEVHWSFHPLQPSKWPLLRRLGRRHLGGCIQTSSAPSLAGSPRNCERNGPLGHGWCRSFWAVFFFSESLPGGPSGHVNTSKGFHLPAVFGHRRPLGVGALNVFLQPTRGVNRKSSLVLLNRFSGTTSSLPSQVLPGMTR